LVLTGIYLTVLLFAINEDFFDDISRIAIGLAAVYGNGRNYVDVKMIAIAVYGTHADQAGS